MHKTNYGGYRTISKIPIKMDLVCSFSKDLYDICVSGGIFLHLCQRLLVDIIRGGYLPEVFLKHNGEFHAKKLFI